MKHPIGIWRKTKGFTLVELITVIVILGVLAVTAAPRFINLGTDARIQVLESYKAALATGADMVHYKAVIANKNTCDASDSLNVDIGGEQVSLRCGYPCAHPSGIPKVVAEEAQFNWVGGNCGGFLGAVEAELSTAPDPANCKIRYAARRVGQDKPEFSLTTSGC